VLTFTATRSNSAPIDVVLDRAVAVWEIVKARWTYGEWMIASSQTLQSFANMLER